MDKYKLLEMLRTSATNGLLAVSGPYSAWASPAARYHFERISELLTDLDKVFQGEQKEPLIAQLNASVREKHK